MIPSFLFFTKRTKDVERHSPELFRRGNFYRTVLHPSFRIGLPLLQAHDTAIDLSSLPEKHDGIVFSEIRFNLNGNASESPFSPVLSVLKNSSYGKKFIYQRGAGRAAEFQRLGDFRPGDSRMVKDIRIHILQVPFPDIRLFDLIRLFHTYFPPLV